MDKRGGSHKSWKSRFFVLSTAGLQYYPSEKATSKEPLGTWRFDDHLFYVVRQLKKAPRPELGFCIRQKETPLWPTNPKEVLSTVLLLLLFMPNSLLTAARVL